jgi:hypothetical protein
LPWLFDNFTARVLADNNDHVNCPCSKVNPVENIK